MPVRKLLVPAMNTLQHARDELTLGALQKKSTSSSLPHTTTARILGRSSYSLLRASSETSKRKDCWTDAQVSTLRPGSEDSPLAYLDLTGYLDTLSWCLGCLAGTEIDKKESQIIS